ncbi:unnamed protein product, partial [Allacma fusca]
MSTEGARTALLPTQKRGSSSLFLRIREWTTQVISGELNCHSDRSSVMPFGCTICLVDLERCPTSESNGPIESLRQSSGITAVPCGHVFHTVCIMQWLQCGEGCPYCREPFEEDEMQE